MVEQVRPIFKKKRAQVQIHIDNTIEIKQKRQIKLKTDLDRNKRIQKAVEELSSLDLKQLERAEELKNQENQILKSRGLFTQIGYENNTEVLNHQKTRPLSPKTKIAQQRDTKIHAPPPEQIDYKYNKPASVTWLWYCKLNSRDSFLMILEFILIGRQSFKQITNLLRKSGDEFYERFISKASQFYKHDWRISPEIKVSDHFTQSEINWTPQECIDPTTMIFSLLSQRQLSRIEYFEFGYISALTFIFGTKDSCMREKCPVGATYDRSKQEAIHGFDLPQECDNKSLARLDFALNKWQFMGKYNYDLCSIYAYDRENDLYDCAQGGYAENFWISLELEPNEVIVGARMGTYYKNDPSYFQFVIVNVESLKKIHEFEKQQLMTI